MQERKIAWSTRRDRPLASSSGVVWSTKFAPIVTAVDLRPRLELPPRPEGSEPIHVVVRHEDGVISLLVDEIGDVFEATDENFEPLPATVHGVSREFVRGIYKVGPRLLLSLDVAAVLDLSGAVLLPAAAS